jgi:hypothetical protein
VFWHSDKPRERLLADAFAQGARAHGDVVELHPLEAEPRVLDCDVACMVGVKSRELFRAHFNAGSHVLYFDKGYTRHASPSPVKLWEYWRVALDAHQPTDRLARMPPPGVGRWDRLGLVMQPWRRGNEEDTATVSELAQVSREHARKAPGHILLAGSSQKYHDFYGLKDPTSWARKVVAALREETKREIVYRPKPSWKDAVPIEGTRFSSGAETIDEVLAGAWAVVTHGSNACFEAVLAGVPVVALGDAVAKPISSTTLDAIESPRRASYVERLQWAARLSYWQWTMPEMATGQAWAFLRPQVFG